MQVLSTCRLNCCFNPGPLYENQTDITVEYLDEVEDPVLSLYHTMQPRRQHRQLENNEMANLINVLDKSNISDSSQNNIENLVQQPQLETQQPQPETQQPQSETATQVDAFCLFCGKQYAKKGHWLTKHQNACSRNPDNQNI